MKLFLQKDADTQAVLGVIDDDRFNGIRCPKCHWKPQASSRWMCSICDCLWNTFDTHAKCPDCSFSYRETACLSCHRMSPHEDWYGLRDGQPK